MEEEEEKMGPPPPEYKIVRKGEKKRAEPKKWAKGLGQKIGSPEAQELLQKERAEPKDIEIDFIKKSQKFGKNKYPVAKNLEAYRIANRGRFSQDFNQKISKLIGQIEFNEHIGKFQEGLGYEPVKYYLTGKQHADFWENPET
jgi:hypothetical protein